MNKLRLVFDTNALVSSILIRDSIPDLALKKARQNGILLFSEVTLEELESILKRPKFDKYVALPLREQFLVKLKLETEIIVIRETIQVCRDSKDNHILDVAVNGKASHIITGDQDLLVLNPFRNIKIITSSHFLQDVF